jgi:N-methylhydantoinase A/oxoprolinase/acetone carboxylase beta subunit
LRIGIDAGGTFTDFVILDDAGRLSAFKLRSNPADPAAVILEGIRRIGAGTAEIVHGSTVATNALLERKGARTALITTPGFEDLLAIGRQNRRELYNLTPVAREPLIELSLSPRGALTKLRRAGIESVAICLLHSYRDPAEEIALAERLSHEFLVSRSSEISPEFREYERASTTVANAYVAPLMQSYLHRLSRESPHPVLVMQSNGGVLDAETAGRLAVRTILSGPAGGVAGAFEIARRAGFQKIIGFDMGGTSTDVSLCDGRFEETTETYIDGMPVRVPMLDIHTIGAGGGSIARIDEGGLLKVGPASAGADPGPACYGKGSLPTVTDANLVLGRVRTLLGGEMALDRSRAIASMGSLGMKTGVAAAGIVRVANANMERAIRTISVERGRDPRDFALLAFGGAAGLHACELAESLGMTTVLVPFHAGVLSALGMLVADRIRDFSISAIGRRDYEALFRQMEAAAPAGARERFADLRYRGQSYELTVPWRNAERNFERLHQKLYGLAMRSEIEAVTLRLRVREKTRKPRWTGTVASRPARGRGPRLIEDYGSTVYVAPNWRFETNSDGTLILRR